jgi:WS/DGAT/MGAT family acyltransferase
MNWKGETVSDRTDTEPTDRLNPTDATLWEIQRDPELRTTIVALAVLDRRPPMAALGAAVERAIETIPRLRQRVVEGPLGLGRPHWEACTPDLGFHLRREPVANKGGLQPVLDVCGDLAGEGFDPDRPLWEMVLIEGWDDHRAALALKISHTLTDGLGGVGLLEAFGEEGHTPKEPDHDRSSGHSRLATIGELASLPAQMASTALKASIHPVRSFRQTAEGAASAARLVKPSGPPLSSLTTGRGTTRWTGVTELPVERLRASAHRGGGTINEAFITIGLRAMADYHRSFGAEDSAFRVTMPISFRSESDPSGGNQWTPARLILRADLDAHPYTDMARHRERLHAARGEPSVGFSQTVAAALHELPSSLTIGIVAGLAKGSDLVMTNVPGLTKPLRVAGANVEGLYPFAPATGTAVNIGLMSHLDRACVGFTVDTAAVADPEHLVACFETHASDVLRRRKAPATRPLPVSPSRGTTAGSSRAPAFEPMSALDMSFLRMETATTPMHMGGLFIIDGQDLFTADGELDLERLRAHVSSRLETSPRLGRKVKEVPLELGRPVWVDEPSIDLRHHIRTAAVDAPGGWPQLLEACEKLQMELLDRDRPLFEFHFLTGLDPDVFGPDAVALVDKIHHALLDGMSGVESLALLFDPASPGAPVVPVPGWPADHHSNRGGSKQPTSLRLAISGLVDQGREPGRLLSSAVGAFRHPRRLAADLATTMWSIADLVEPNAAVSLNRQPVGDERLLRPISVPLEVVRETAHRLGGTVNDVVLTAVASGLRSLFESRDEAVDDRITALVPVSTRRSGLEEEHGNHVAALVVDLPVSEEDLGEAFRATAAQVKELKRHHHAEGSDLMLEAANHLPPLAVDLIARMVSHQPFVNVVVTNLPGPPTALHLQGGEVRTAIPIVPLGGNLSLGVAVLSYCDDLTLAFHADAAGCPDVDVVADATRAALLALAETAGVGS